MRGRHRIPVIRVRYASRPPGLILAASLVMLHEAQTPAQRRPLARFALWLGIGAALATPRSEYSG
jgi:hypothetical protein